MANEYTTGPRTERTEYDAPKDAREKGGTYPNYWVRKTRSGHIMMLDDTKGNEHMTFQHRSGSMIQFLPDGATNFTTNKGRYDVTFGEHRTKATGSYDVTADNSVTMKAKNNFNMTSYGDTYMSTRGASIETAANKNCLYSEHCDMQSASMAMHTRNGSTMSSDGAVTVTSTTAFAAGSSKGGSIISSGMTTHIVSKTGTAVKSDGPVELSTLGGAQIKFEGNYVYINSGRAPIKPSALQTPPQPDISLPPPGLEGPEGPIPA